MITSAYMAIRCCSSADELSNATVAREVARCHTEQPRQVRRAIPFAGRALELV